jgi:Ycf4
MFKDFTRALAMTTKTMTQESKLLHQEVLGSRRFSNYLWATISSIGGIGFLLAGLSSYFHINLLIVSDPSELQFIPQGVALSFYGVAGSLVALYLWLVILLDVGGGYNEFNQKTGKIKIFRWGFPGKNRRIEFTCEFKDVQSVRAEIKEGLSPKRSIYLRIKQRRDVPLTRVGEPLPLSELENQAAQLARFLEVPLEGL